MREGTSVTESSGTRVGARARLPGLARHNCASLRLCLDADVEREALNAALAEIGVHLQDDTCCIKCSYTSESVKHVAVIWLWMREAPHACHAHLTLMTAEAAARGGADYASREEYEGAAPVSVGALWRLATVVGRAVVASDGTAYFAFDANAYGSLIPLPLDVQAVPWQIRGLRMVRGAEECDSVIVDLGDAGSRVVHVTVRTSIPSSGDSFLEEVLQAAVDLQGEWIVPKGKGVDHENGL